MMHVAQGTQVTAQKSRTVDTSAKSHAEST